MPMKVQLFQTWIYGGKFYGPGEADIPDELHAELQAKGALEAPPPPELPNRSMLSGDQSGGQSAPELAPEIAEKLAEGGFDTVEAICAASDDELLAVKGIGPAALRDIRAA